MAEQWRKHVDRKIDKRYFRTEVIRQGSPFRLYVEKTQLAMAVSNVQLWIARVYMARTQLNKLSSKSILKEILGDKFHTLWKHENLQIPEDDPTFKELKILTRENTTSLVTSIVPSKRSWER